MSESGRASSQELALTRRGFVQFCIALMAITISWPATSPRGQDKSLRQERADAQAAMIKSAESMAYCLGYFDPNGDAAEALELKSGFPKQDVRRFVENMGNTRRALNLDQVKMARTIQCDGDKSCIQAMTDATERGLRLGNTASGTKDLDAIKGQFKDCALRFGTVSPEYFESPTPFRLTLLPSSRIQISAADVEALQKKIQPCFKLPPNVKRGPVDLDVYLDEHFRVYSTNHDIHRADGPDADLWTAVARAVSKPDCQPLNVSGLNYKGGPLRLSLQFTPLPLSAPPASPANASTSQQPVPALSQPRQNVDNIVDSILKEQERPKIAARQAPPPTTADLPPAPETPKKNIAEAMSGPPKPEDKKVEVERPKPVEDKIVLKPKEPEPPKLQAAVAPNLATVLTASEIEAVRQKIRPCWQLPKAVAQDASLVVALVVQLKPDGRPISAEITDQDRYSRDPLFRVAADAARRAVLHPSCQPWPLAPEKYFAWRMATLSFDPRNY